MTLGEVSTTGTILLRGETSTPPAANAARVLGAAGRSEWAAAIAAFVCLALLITGGFYAEGRNLKTSALSGDQLNIVAIAQKQDTPDLFRGDFVFGDVRNTDYYIPAFVKTLRWLASPDRNYLGALNLMLLATSLIYMAGWFVLLSVWEEPWVAVLGAFLARGIMWPPGNEFWGIAGLWSMVPRTLYLALLPWVTWFWFRFRKRRYGFWLACLMAGLILNIHPISGLVFAAGLPAAEYVWRRRARSGCEAGSIRVGILLIFLSTLPSLMLYFSGVRASHSIDPAEFQQALLMRLDPLFFSPSLYLKAWLRPEWLILVAGPWAAWMLLPRNARSRLGNFTVPLSVLALSAAALAAVPWAAKLALESLGVELRYSHEFLRAGKYVIYPSFVLWTLVAAIVCRLMRGHLGKAWPIWVTVLAVLLVSLVSRHRLFYRVPVVNSDFLRALWPSQVRPAHPFGRNRVRLEATLDWVVRNTPADARFVGPRILRVAAQRSIVHERAGAVLLIEGNRQAYLDFYRRERLARSASYASPLKRAMLYRSWGADYWLTRMGIDGLRPAYVNDTWFLYRLADLDSQVSKQ